MALETEALINLDAAGGESSAAQLAMVSQGMSEMEGRTINLQEVFSRRMEMTGIREMSRGMAEMTGATAGGEAALVGLHLAMHALVNTIEIFTGPIGWLIAALGLVTAGVLAWHHAHREVAQSAEQVIERVAELTKGAKDQLQIFKDATDAGVKLTGEQREQRAALQAVVDAQAAVDSDDVLKKRGAAYDAWVKATKVLEDYNKTAHGVRSITLEHTEALAKANYELSKLDDTTGAVVKSTERQAKALELKKFWTLSAAEADVNAANMLDKYDKEQEKAAQATERSATKIGSMLNTVTGPAIKDWMAQTGILADTTSSHMSRVEKRWHEMANAVVEEIERILVKMLVLEAVQLATMPAGGGLGLGGLFAKAAGFQFGGVIPGNTGQPVMVQAHAGERIVSDTGKGGGGSGAGGPMITQNITVGGAFASMRELQRSQRRSIRSIGEPGLV